MAQPAQERAAERTPIPPPLPPPVALQEDTSVALTSAMKKAAIPEFSLVGLPSPDRPTSYNDDRRLGSFRPIRYTRAGEQRQGIATYIDDASSIDDHLRKSIEADFSLSQEIPLPSEVARSIRIVDGSSHMALRAWRKLQLDRAMGLVNSAADLQEFWNFPTPASIRSATGRLHTVALALLLKAFDLGGANWIEQFPYGFPIVSGLSQEGAYPRDTSRRPPRPHP